MASQSGACSHDDVDGQEVIPTNHIGVNYSAITVVQQGEEQPKVKLDVVIVTGGVGPVQVDQLQQPAAVVVAVAADDQNLQNLGDDTGGDTGGDTVVVVDLEGQLGVVDQLMTSVLNISDPIMRLRLITASTLFISVMVGVLYLAGGNHRVQTNGPRARFIASVGAPITVSAFSFLSTFCLANDPNRRNSIWITILSAINFSLLVGPLAGYWMLPRGTQN